MTSSSLAKLCTVGDDSIISSQQYMYIYFYTDTSNTGTGFKLKYYAVEHDDGMVCKMFYELYMIMLIIN